MCLDLVRADFSVCSGTDESVLPGFLSLIERHITLQTVSSKWTNGMYVTAFGFHYDL
jgi:hypothetical protein